MTGEFLLVCEHEAKGVLRYGDRMGPLGARDYDVGVNELVAQNLIRSRVEQVHPTQSPAILKDFPRDSGVHPG